jgi:hypothetical protein
MQLQFVTNRRIGNLGHQEDARGFSEPFIFTDRLHFIQACFWLTFQKRYIYAYIIIMKDYLINMVRDNFGTQNNKTNR